MRIDTQVREHLADWPLDMTDILRACIASQGLQAVLEGIAELFGASGQEEPAATPCCHCQYPKEEELCPGI